MDVRQGATVPLRLPVGRVWTDPTAVVVSASGTELEAPDVTVASTTTTVASGGSTTSMALASVSGLSVGSRLGVTSQGVTSVCTVGRIDGTTVHLEEALAHAPAAGDPVSLLEVALDLTTATTDTLRRGVLVVVRDGGSQDEVRVLVSVLRYPLPQLVSSRELRERVTRIWPSGTSLVSELTLQRIAERTQERVRARLSAQGELADRFWDPSSLTEVADLVSRVLLAEDLGLVPPGETPADYIDQTERRLHYRVQSLLQSADPRDRDDDGAIQAAEALAESWIRSTR